jgi:hypothetical protein
MLAIVTHGHYVIKKTAVGCMERQSAIVGGQHRLKLCKMGAEYFTRNSIVGPGCGVPRKGLYYSVIP